MKFNQQLPDDSVNVSNENSFFKMLKLLAVLLVFSFLIYGTLKVVLEVVVDNLSPSFEEKLTQFVSIDMDIGTPLSNSYLDEITADIAKCANIPYDVKVFIIPDLTPNAFALPGGTIYITKGMLKSIKNQNELASIIGHEMGHFKNRHHLKSLGTSLLYSLLTLTLGEGYGTILNTTLDISNVKYSQSAELEADAFALDVMECTYGNVSDSMTLFSRLSVGSGSEWDYFFATHPAFSTRLQKMKEHIESKGYDTNAKVIPLREKF